LAEIADAVWDEVVNAGHAVANSAAVDLVAVLADTNELQVDDYPASIAAVKSDTAAILVDTSTTLDDLIDTEIGSILTTLGTPAGASLAADIAAIEAQTDDIGIAGAGLTAVPWNSTWDAEVESEANDAIVANNLDHVALTAVAIPAIPAGTYIDQMMDDGTAVFDRTTDSLQAVRDRGDAAWDTADVSALALETTAQSILTDTGTTLDDLVDDLETRLSATRAGYLDNLSAGAVATAASIAALNNLSAAQINAEVVDVLRTDTLPDSYAADAAQPTIAQAILAIQQFLTEKAVSGTTVTVKKPDGSTTAMTLTLSDATNPTSITRAT
jgi:hypothetical protein